jgi:PEGA domain
MTCQKLAQAYSAKWYNVRSSTATDLSETSQAHSRHAEKQERPVNNLTTARISIAQRPEVKVPIDDTATSALDVFGTESNVIDSSKKTTPPPVASQQPRLTSVAKWIGVIALSAAATAGGIWFYLQRTTAVAPGSLTLNTVPPGLEVSLAGKVAGLTPLTLSLPPGDHRVQVTGAGGQPREVAVTLKAGETVVQHLEMAAVPPATPVPTTGSLRIQTEPQRQAVMVDGIDRGISPVTVTSLAAGDHLVVIRGERGTIRRNVTVEPGATLSLVISPTESSAASGGWLTIASPVVLQLKEDGKLIGTTETERLMIPAGEHEIEMANDALGYRTVQRVVVAAGRTTNTRVQVPNGMLSINAQPWAEVWVGGERVGETPIANLSRPIGVHQVVLRHPEFGQRTASITVSLKQTARLGVDMRKP